MTIGASVAVPCRNILGESAVWSVREQALWWVDLRAPALFRLTPSTGAVDEWPMPDFACGVVLAARGVVMVGRRGLSRFDPADGSLTALVEIEPAALDNRLNEARTDRQGRLWVGSMRDLGAAVTGSLYRVTGDLVVERRLSDIRVPNSLAWSPDGRTMYFADTGDGRIRAYDYDPATGEPGAERVLLAADGAPGRPDGSTVDAEGFLWTTRVGAGVVARIAPDGRVDRLVSLTASQPTSCTLGGTDLKTLYVTTARQRLSDEDLAAQPDAGALFAIRVDIPGAPEAEFAL